MSVSDETLWPFVLVCQELQIPNIEYTTLSNKIIHGTSIQEWADFSKEQFIEHQKFLTISEKELLISYLIQCEETLRLPPPVGDLS